MDHWCDSARRRWRHRWPQLTPQPTRRSASRANSSDRRVIAVRLSHCTKPLPQARLSLGVSRDPRDLLNGNRRCHRRTGVASTRRSDGRPPTQVFGVASKMLKPEATLWGFKDVHTPGTVIRRDAHQHVPTASTQSSHNSGMSCSAASAVASAGSAGSGKKITACAPASTIECT